MKKILVILFLLFLNFFQAQTLANEERTFLTGKIESADFLNISIKIANSSEAEVILIDLNDAEENICTEVIYLIEPGIIKLNKLLKGNQEFREKIKNGKVILNRSAIKNEDISNFEYETKINVFFNLTNFNERKDRIQIIDDLILKLTSPKAFSISSLALSKQIKILSKLNQYKYNPLTKEEMVNLFDDIKEVK